MNISLVADIAFLVSIPTAVLLVKFYLPGYFKEKGKNLATKEDVAAITKKIEEVKVEYAKQLELYKSEIWRGQQKYLLMQEEAKLKVETFKKAVVDVAKIINIINSYQIHASNREMAAAIADMAYEKGNEEVQKDNWNAYLDYNEKAAALYLEFREVIVGLGETFALFSLYFDSVMDESLKRIIMMAHEAIELKMPRAEFRKRLEDECNKGLDLNVARNNVGSYYDTLCDVKLITVESNRFFRLMKNYIKLEESKNNSADIE